MIILKYGSKIFKTFWFQEDMEPLSVAMQRWINIFGSNWLDSNLLKKR